MNNTVKVIVLFVAIFAAFSFSQDSLPARSAGLTGKFLVCDTVTGGQVISAGMTLEALTNAQTFYSNSFGWLIGILTLALMVLGFFDITFVKRIKKDVKRKLKEHRRKLERELKTQNEKVEALLKESSKKFEQERVAQNEKFEKSINDIDTKVHNRTEKFDNLYSRLEEVFSKRPASAANKDGTDKRDS